MLGLSKTKTLPPFIDRPLIKKKELLPSSCIDRLIVAVLPNEEGVKVIALISSNNSPAESRVWLPDASEFVMVAISYENTWYSTVISVDTLGVIQISSSTSQGNHIQSPPYSLPISSVSVGDPAPALPIVILKYSV